jgi:type I restriction enzyme R subunit
LEIAPKEQLEQAKKQQKVYSAKLRKASKALYLNEEVTRIVIDQHLVDADWEADTQS